MESCQPSDFAIGNQQSTTRVATVFAIDFAQLISPAVPLLSADQEVPVRVPVQQTQDSNPLLAAQDCPFRFQFSKRKATIHYLLRKTCLLRFQLRKLHFSFYKRRYDSIEDRGVRTASGVPEVVGVAQQTRFTGSKKANSACKLNFALCLLTRCWWWCRKTFCAQVG